MRGGVVPVCARLMRADPVLADRMWSGGVRGNGGLDRAARARAVRLCRACPVRVDCLVDAMPVARMRDDTTIVGGLTTPARARLQRLVADGLHAPASLAGIPPRMVRMWLLAHPDAPDQACRQTQAQWSGAKRRWRAARARPAPTVGVPASRVMVQGELDLGW